MTSEIYEINKPKLNNKSRGKIAKKYGIDEFLIRAVLANGTR